MIPKTGQKIAVLFRNGLSETGVVSSWDNNKAVLKSPANHLFIIQDIEKDVMAIKIFAGEDPINVLKSQETEELQLTGNIQDRAKSLVQLRKEQAEAQKDLVKEHFKTAIGTTNVEYGPPRIQKPFNFNSRPKINSRNK